jgi:hypothetical protein
MSTYELNSYIEKIKKRISKKIPEKYLTKIMEDISNMVVSNWVNGEDFELTKDQIEFIKNKYNKNI